MDCQQAYDTGFVDGLRAFAWTRDDSGPMVGHPETSQPLHVALEGRQAMKHYQPPKLVKSAQSAYDQGFRNGLWASMWRTGRDSLMVGHPDNAMGLSKAFEIAEFLETYRPPAKEQPE